MIKLIFKYLFYLVFFCYMLIVFTPKTNLYYLGLEKLQSFKVALISNKIEDNYFSFNIEDLSVNYDNIKVAEVDSVALSTYLYKSKIKVNNIKANDVLKYFIPKFVKEILITHSILNPLKIEINALFQKGRAFGYVDLIQNKIIINLDVPKSFIVQYKDLTNKFKKKGKYYTYEYKY